MHYEPTPAELLYLDDMDNDERLHYFITRTMETEEVWSLCDVGGWVTRDVSGTLVMPLWPYMGLARDCAKLGEAPDAVSLEHFVYQELPELAENGIKVEVFPGKRTEGKRGGILMDAAMLFQLFDSKLEQEQYFIEG